MATGVPKPAAPSMKAPKLKAINKAGCGGARDARQLPLQHGKLPGFHAEVVNEDRIEIIQPMGKSRRRRPKRPPPPPAAPACDTPPLRSPPRPAGRPARRIERAHARTPANRARSHSAAPRAEPRRPRFPTVRNSGAKSWRRQRGWGWSRDMDGVVHNNFDGQAFKPGLSRQATNHAKAGKARQFLILKAQNMGTNCQSRWSHCQSGTVGETVSREF